MTFTKTKIKTPRRTKWEETHKKNMRKRKAKILLNKSLVVAIFLLFATNAYLRLLNEIKLVEVDYTKMALQAAEIGQNSPNSAVLEALVGTNMEDAIPYIEKASQYYNLPPALFVGIANAESSLNNFRCYNPWGVDTGKGNDPRCYNNWEHSVNGFAQLIRYYYFDEGKITPEQMLLKYVGWNNPHWVGNVRAYYDPKVVIEF